MRRRKMGKYPKINISDRCPICPSDRISFLDQYRVGPWSRRVTLICPDEHIIFQDEWVVKNQTAYRKF